MTAASPPPREITIRYFAWVREKTGLSHERIAVPHTVVTIADLVTYLTARGPEYAAAFATPAAVRAAIDKVHVKPGTAIANAEEIAFFPPVTGG